MTTSTQHPSTQHRIPPVTLSKVRNPRVRVAHRWYGTGTVVRPQGQFQVVVRFDRSDLYVGARPVIVMAHEVTEIR